MKLDLSCKGLTDAEVKKVVQEATARLIEAQLKRKEDKSGS